MFRKPQLLQQVEVAPEYLLHRLPLQQLPKQRQHPADDQGYRCPPPGGTRLTSARAHSQTWDWQPR